MPEFSNSAARHVYEGVGLVIGDNSSTAGDGSLRGDVKDSSGTARGWSNGAVTNADGYHFDTSNIKGFRFVTSGTVSLKDADGNSMAITGVVNDEFAYAPYKVMATGSTATIQLLTSSGSVTRTADA